MPPQMRMILMLKQINYGPHETIEGSHRTVSEAVCMYAIYYSDWTEVLNDLSEYYASDEWKDAFDCRTEKHLELVRRRNFAIRNIQEVGKELRSIGLHVDLCEWATEDDFGLEVAA
mgnify:CR=1 FL=1